MRRLAVRRVKTGETQADVARSLEVHARTVSKWVVGERTGGAKALARREGGGRPRALTAQETALLRRLVVGKNPSQLSFGTSLWTVAIVQAVIETEFHKAVHQTTVMRTLRRLGLSPQKPIRRAFRRDESACRRWAQDEFPAVVRKVRRQQATLLFADESGVHEDGPVGTTWGRKGKRPVVKVTGGRRRTNVISAVSPRGRLWFRCFPGTLNAPLFIAFLEALISDVKGKIVLVLDRHPAHVAAATRRWLLAHRSRIEVHHLPSYAPDMNPDEHVWSYLKGLFRRAPLTAAENLSDSVEGAMRDIARDRPLVRSFFHHPDVAYVRDALKW